MAVQCRATATVRRESDRGEERATVTLVLNETEAQERYWRTLCRHDQVALRGIGDAEPGETFKTCESAIYGGVFYALRKLEGHFAFLVIDVQGEIGEGGADGFALAAAHAVWHGAGYQPREEDLPELPEWRFDGEVEIKEPRAGDLKRPGVPTMPGEDRIDRED